MKKKLTIPAQICHMKEIGVQFNLVPEEKAVEFLTYSTYFFKIKAYAKNFEKYKSGENEGQYMNLDFAYLQELSILDMRLRKIILSMTLNIEHCLKVQLNRHLCGNDAEDGYNIVSMFLNANDFVKKSIIGKKLTNSPYTKDLIDKYEDQFAAWNFIELLSFGEFINFYKYYYNQYENNDILGLLLPVKSLRNAAAHNNCLIHDLNRIIRDEYVREDKKFNLSIKLNTMVAKIPTISKGSRSKKMRIPTEIN